MVAEVCDDTIQDTTLMSAMVYGALACSMNLVLSLTCGSRKKFGMMGILTVSREIKQLHSNLHILTKQFKISRTFLETFVLFKMYKNSEIQRSY